MAAAQAVVKSAPCLSAGVDARDAFSSAGLVDLRWVSRFGVAE